MIKIKIAFSVFVLNEFFSHSARQLLNKYIFLSVKS